MKRTTVFLDDALIRRARQYARRHGVSFAAVIRDAVSVYIVGPGKGGGGLPPLTGRFGSGRADTSERVDQLLSQDPHS
jgi:hypothetical protein